MENTRKSPNIDAVSTPLHDAASECLARYVKADDTLLVALSGGIDSVVLLHLFATQIRPQNLAALHVNHGISPYANDWAEFCRDLCRNLSVRFFSVNVTVERDSADGLEAAARRVRHAAFARADFDWVVLAHHRDDQAETLLFNLLRGCGIAGAGAMRERNGRLLRPFLSVARETIERYAQLAGLQWCEDDSNADILHTRNFIRQRIIPELKQRFPAVSARLAGAAERFAEASDMLDALALVDLQGAVADFPVAVDTLAVLDEARARNVLRYLLRQKHVQIPGERRLREALRQMLSAAVDRHPSVIWGPYRLVRRQRQIYLELLPDNN